MAQKQKGKDVTPSREELVSDIKEVMTLLSELKHEPHGGGRQAMHHSHRLAELVHELHQEIRNVPENERQEWEQSLKAVSELHVDGKDGRTLGEYIKSNEIDSWGKDWCSHWENSDHHEAMQQELQDCTELLRKTCCSPKKR